MKPELVVLVGLPGSGKSEVAEEYIRTHDAVVISSSEMRELVFGDANNYGHKKQLFKAIHETIKNVLECKQSVVYDATNLERKNRMELLNYIAGVPCTKKCIIVVKSYEECIENINRFGKETPPYVVDGQYKKFETPWYVEGFDEIEIINNGEDHVTPEAMVASLMNYDQESKNHQKDLGMHLLETSQRVHNIMGYDLTLQYAALLHDIGKPYTKSYIKKNGEVSDHALYYSHHNCGAYDSLMVDVPETVKKLDMSNLICLHMEPYFWKNEADAEKFKEFWGEDIYDRIMVLHGADQLAH